MLTKKTHKSIQKSINTMKALLDGIGNEQDKSEWKGAPYRPCLCGHCGVVWAYESVPVAYFVGPDDTESPQTEEVRQRNMILFCRAANAATLPIIKRVQNWIGRTFRGRA